MKTPKTLVTGSRGFIGRAVMLNMAGRVAPFDIADDKGQDVTIARALWKHSGGCDSIAHFAAIPGVEQCRRNPRGAYATNCRGTFTLLHTAHRQAIKRVVFASSAAADRRDSVYGWTKFSGESWCQMAREQWGMDLTVLRLANVYGPGSIQKGSVVAKWMRQILYGNAPKIAVYGGQQLRDFVFVEDVANVIAWRLRQMEPWDDEAWHYVGTRTLTTLSDLAFMVVEIGKELGVTHGVSIIHKAPVDEGHVAVPGSPDKRFDCPTTLVDGIEETWKYFIRQHEKGTAVDVEEVAS